MRWYARCFYPSVLFCQTRYEIITAEGHFAAERRTRVQTVQERVDGDREPREWHGRLCDGTASTVTDETIYLGSWKQNLAAGLDDLSGGE
jgi:hypothetical protein